MHTFWKKERKRKLSSYPKFIIIVVVNLHTVQDSHKKECITRNSSSHFSEQSNMVVW